jgi:hypothetical protein
MKILVSYQYPTGLCGNKVFDIPQDVTQKEFDVCRKSVVQWINGTKNEWKSFSVFRYGQETLPGAFDLIPVDIGQFSE